MQSTKNCCKNQDDAGHCLAPSCQAVYVTFIPLWLRGYDFNPGTLGPQFETNIIHRCVCRVEPVQEVLAIINPKLNKSVTTG